MAKKRIPDKLQAWIDARKQRHLSHAHVQMARELGMNPKKLGKIDNHKQEPWKMPLPQFIEHLYRKRFGKAQPDRVISIEVHAKEIARKKEKKREAKRLKREQRAKELAPAGASPSTDPSPK
jgi:hypothetical protein